MHNNNTQDSDPHEPTVTSESRMKLQFNRLLSDLWFWLKLGVSIGIMIAIAGALFWGIWKVYQDMENEIAVGQISVMLQTPPSHAELYGVVQSGAKLVFLKA